MKKNLKVKDEDFAKMKKVYANRTKYIELDKHLYPMYELHLTDESELGHKCGMAKLFKKYIKSTVVKDYEDLRGFR